MQRNIEKAVEFFIRAETFEAYLDDPYHLDMVRRALNKVQSENPNQDEDG